jgi:CHAT domain-containing protein
MLLAALYFSCRFKTQQKQKSGLPVTGNYRKELLTYDSLIGLTTDSQQLVTLYNSKLAISEQVQDLFIWANAQLELYTIKSEGLNNDAIGMEHLNAVIAKEPELAKYDSMKPLLAKAFGLRYYIFEQQNSNHKVIADCEKYLQYSTPDLDKEYLPFILNAGGIAYCKIGDYQESVNKLEQLLHLTQNEPDAENMGLAYVNLANSYYNLGNNPKTLEIAGAGLTRSVISNEHKAYLYGIIANAAIENKNYSLASNSIQNAIKLAPKEEGNNQLADFYSIEGDLNDALKNNRALQSYRKAEQYISKNNSGLPKRELAKLYIKIGNLAIEQKDWDTAITQNNKALAVLFSNMKKQQGVAMPDDRDLFPENAVMDALDANAKALMLRAGTGNNPIDLSAALVCINKAFTVESMLRQLCIFDKSKYAGTASGKNRSATAVAICNRLFMATSRKEWAEKAFLFSEKSKANVLMDKVRENMLLNQNDNTVKHARSVLLMLEEVNQQLNAETKKTAPDEEKTGNLKKDKAALEKEFAIYKSMINTRIFEQNRELADHEKMDEIKNKLLTNDNCIVEYFIADSLLYLFKADRIQGVQMQMVPYTEMEKLLLAILPYYNQPDLYNNHPATYDSLARQLYHILLEPFANNLQKKDILLIPDGILFSLPFESLKNNQNQYLIFQNNIVYGFSCASLLEQSIIKSQAPVNSIAAFAPFVKGSRSVLAPLVQSGNEIKAVSALNKNATIYTDTKASLQTFIQQAGKFSVLHLATHAVADHKDRDATRIEFADSGLNISKVYGLSINNNLVVLSACETGVGVLQQAEGALSMARAFYYAGAKNVINSLWKVDDKSTGKIFSTFYKMLSNRTNIAEALYQSKLGYLNTADKEHLSPYYWSSFICIGTGTLSVPGSAIPLWYYFTGFAVLLLFTGIIFRKRIFKRKTRL